VLSKAISIKKIDMKNKNKLKISFGMNAVLSIITAAVKHESNLRPKMLMKPLE
jgi:hypothetical protein